MSLTTNTVVDDFDDTNDLLATADAAVVGHRIENCMDHRLEQAAKILGDAGRRNLSDTEYRQMKAAVDSAAENARLLTEIRAIRAEKESRMAVRREPRTYSPDSPHSYFLDLAFSSLPNHPQRYSAQARLERHAVELAGEYRHKATSPESRHIEKSVRSMCRENRDPTRAEAEFRAMSSGATSGLAFVTPAYLVDQWVRFRENPPAFIEQLPMQPVPEWGLSVYIPAMDSAADVEEQTDGGAVGETAPGAGYIGADLATYAGEITLSQQLYDRAGPGQGFDGVAYRQMAEEYWQAVDAAAIGDALSGAATITNTGSFGLSGLYGDLLNARKKLETASGVKLRPTSAWFLPAPWGFIASQTDGAGRPLLVPSPLRADMMVAPNPVDEDLPPAGFTGYDFGGVPAFTDGSIPLTSGQATILVVNGPSLLPYVDKAPTVAVFPETYASTLQVIVRLHGYAGTIIRHAKGVVAISGAAYAANPTFAG